MWIDVYLTCVATICLVTAHVLGISFKWARFDCNDTFTTSNGFTRIASVTPAPSPASENVCQHKHNKTQHFWQVCKPHHHPSLVCVMLISFGSTALTAICVKLVYCNVIPLLGFKIKTFKSMMKYISFKYTTWMGLLLKII